MSVRRRKSKRDRKIKEMLLERHPIAAIARYANISETRVRQIIGDFIVSGELVRVPNTYPAIYTDPHACAMGETADIGGGVENNDPLLDSLPESGKVPNGMVGAHISGRISMQVRKKGSFDDIRAENGLYIGFWEKEKSGGKGKRFRRGHVRMFGQDITLDFYESVKGKFEFYVNPGRAYYDPSRVSKDKMVDYLVERSLLVSKVLRSNGWQVTDPKLPDGYQLHRAKENDPLAYLIPPKFHDGVPDRIVTDRSLGFLETELEDVSEERMVEIYADMPKAIRENERSISEQASTIESMRSELTGLEDIARRQTSLLNIMVGNITLLSKSVAEITTLEMNALDSRVASFTGEGYQ